MEMSFECVRRLGRQQGPTQREGGAGRRIKNGLESERALGWTGLHGLSGRQRRRKAREGWTAESRHV